MVLCYQTHNIYVFLFLLIWCTSNMDARELRFLGMLPMTGEVWPGGGACLTSVQMALEDINAREDVLADHNLTYKWVDSQCTAGIAVYRMFEALNNDLPYHMVLGDACSTASAATAQVSHLWNITQFSYGSSSPILSDRRRFPRFFRLALPEQKLNPSRIDLMRTFNWKKVATINEANEFFSVVTDDFVKRVLSTDISIVSQEIFVNDPTTRVQNLKEHDARIIMTSMYEDKARMVLCAAYKIGLYGPKIVWMFVGWYTTTFWKIELENLDCTEEEMSMAAEGSFITGPVYQNHIEERGIANLTAKEFDVLYHNYRTYDPNMKIYEHLANLCYDNVWVAALALDCTIQRLREMGHPKSLEMFAYADKDINDIIYECVGNTSMTGVCGRVVFSSGADPNRIVKMERIQDGERQLVGYYRQDKDPKYFEWIDGAIKWKDGNIPRDSTYVLFEEVKIPMSLYATMTSLAAIGICVALCFFAFNVLYRTNRNVKLSSPNINSVVLLGCVLCYCTVFFKTTESENAIICQARIFCFSLGFTVTFGGLFSKTWRVYRIFTNKKLMKRSIKDYQLMAVIGGLVSLVLVVLVSWETIGSHKILRKDLPKEVYMIGNDAEVHPFVRVCRSELSSYFGWALIIIQGLLLSFGAFLAWETKHVKIQALNDSQQIGVCLYNVVVLSAVGLTLSLLLEEQEVMMYGVTSGCLIIGTTLTQMIIFIPKIHGVYNKVDVNDAMTTGHDTFGQSATQRSGETEIQTVHA